VPDDELTRGQQLANDLLDEMDKPKSPEREAYEARKDREDREALERMYIATGQYEPPKMFSKLLALMANAIEQLNPPDGEFPAIEMPLTFKGHKGSLRFSASGKPHLRNIQLSIESESGLSTSSTYLDNGSNAEIVKYLRRPEVVAETIHTAEESIISFARNRLA